MYSQRDEEKYILEALKESTRKRLLDVGAWDPKCFSNSRALIEQGWGGVLIEPSPGPLRNLVAEYKPRADIEIIAGAVAVESGMINLQITDDAVSAETSSDQVRLWAARGNYIGRMWIKTYTIEEITAMFGAFDFVSIDTEGTSVDLLKVLLKTEMFPTCICVEHDGRIVEAENAARDRGYRLIYSSEENLVFGR